MNKLFIWKGGFIREVRVDGKWVKDNTDITFECILNNFKSFHINMAALHKYCEEQEVPEEELEEFINHIWKQWASESVE